MNRRAFLQSVSAAALAAAASGLGVSAGATVPLAFRARLQPGAAIYDIFVKLGDGGTMQLWAEPKDKDGQRLTTVRFEPETEAFVNAEPIKNGPAAGEAIYSGMIYYTPLDGVISATMQVRDATKDYVCATAGEPIRAGHPVVLKG
jgi:hypothetical protein